MRNKIEKSLIILVFRCTWWFWEQIVFPSKWTIRVSVSLRIVTKNIPLKSLESSGVFPTTTTVLVNRQAIVHQLLSGGVPQVITVIITSPPSCRAASQLPFFVASLVLERQRWEVGNAWLVECPISVKTRQMINHSILTGNRVIFC